jgi:hypothetical protein
MSNIIVLHQTNSTSSEVLVDIGSIKLVVRGSESGSIVTVDSTSISVDEDVETIREMIGK